MQDIQNTKKEAPFLGLTGMGGGAASLGLVGQGVVVGQQTYATAGTYSWTAPDGVESISIVCIGGGGGGNIGRTAGSGGGCAYKNNYTVVPGNSYTVVVGAAGQGAQKDLQSSRTPGGASYFVNSSTVQGGGGA